MHVKTEQIQNLAVSYYKGRLLTDDEVEVKCHMAECDSCYEAFCAELLMLRALADSGLIGDGLWEKEKEISFVKIQLIKDKLEVLCGSLQERLSNIWNFVQMPVLAYGRGVSGQKPDINYISQESEYSCIKKEGSKIQIQLDEEYFPVKRLAVKYMESGNYVYKKFEYDEYSECFMVTVEESALQNGEIEIVEIRGEAPEG